MQSRRYSKMALLALAVGSMALTGCARVKGHQGYIADAVLMDAIQPGIDNRQSVEASLGRPTFTGQFDQNVWYYVSRQTRQYAFNSPRPSDQQIVRISLILRAMCGLLTGRGSNLSPISILTMTKLRHWAEIAGSLKTCSVILVPLARSVSRAVETQPGLKPQFSRLFRLPPIQRALPVLMQPMPWLRSVRGAQVRRA